MSHTYNDQACPACGDLNGCHIPGKVRRYRHRPDNFNAGDAGAAFYGQQAPKIVCLCGSTRFPEAWKKAMFDETLEGNIVLTVGLHGHAEGIDMSGPMKVMLDELHKRKIDHADEVLVLNCDAIRCPRCGLVSRTDVAGHYKCVCGESFHANPLPYVGSSTRSEIEYAKKHGKNVRYLNPTEDES